MLSNFLLEKENQEKVFAENNHHRDKLIFKNYWFQFPFLISFSRIKMHHRWMFSIASSTDNGNSAIFRQMSAYAYKAKTFFFDELFLFVMR